MRRDMAYYRRNPAEVHFVVCFVVLLLMCPCRSHAELCPKKARTAMRT